MSSKLFRTVLVLTESNRTGVVYIISYNFVAALGIQKEAEQ